MSFGPRSGQILPSLKTVLLHRLSSASISVVNAQLAETAAGVTTIRAHKQQDRVSFMFKGHTLTMNAAGRERQKRHQKCSPYVLAEHRRKGVKRGPIIAAILKVSPLLIVSKYKVMIWLGQAPFQIAGYF